MSHSLTPELRKLLTDLRAQGWRIKLTEMGHFKCFAPDKKSIVLVSGSGDFRAIRNAASMLRRAGAVVN